MEYDKWDVLLLLLSILDRTHDMIMIWDIHILISKIYFLSMFYFFSILILKNNFFIIN